MANYDARIHMVLGVHTTSFGAHQMGAFQKDMVVYLFPLEGFSPR